MRIIIIVLCLLLSGCAISPQFQFAPQTVSGGTMTGGILATEDALIPLTTTISDSPCAAAWTAVEEDEPWELAVTDERTMVGDAFRCLGNGPGPAANLATQP